VFDALNLSEKRTYMKGHIDILKKHGVNSKTELGKMQHPALERLFRTIQDETVAASPDQYQISKARTAVEAAAILARGQANPFNLGLNLGGTGLINFKVKGCGLSLKKTPYVANLIKRDEVEGEFVKPKPYRPFGKYLINHHKLSDNIVMIKHVSGKTHRDLPTHKCSQSVANIIKTVGSGVMPHYEHIAGLSTDERDHLHKLFSTCHIDNPIPKPMMKSKDKTELDRFDVLRGEILSGNDNKTLVREFKVLMLKLLHDGRLPKREVHEILVELSAMGF
jgi:hypothetical protein